MTTTSSSVPPAAAGLVPPHGGTLVDRVLTGTARESALAEAAALPSIPLSPWSVSDLELIAIGAVSPLTGFMAASDYRGVVHDMHLSSGLAWSIPITLRVPPSGAPRAERVALRASNGAIVAILEVNDVFTADREVEAQRVYGTTDAAHPGVRQLLTQGETAVGGDVWVLDRAAPPFPALALEPAETRAIFLRRAWRTVVGFQTRNPVHRAHEYLQKTALEIVDGLLLHPLVGETKDDDVPADIRVRSYRALLEHYYPADRVVLAAFPASMRYAGPREAIFHALVRKNYGCTHFIVGRDHAGVGSFYGTYDAQQIFTRFAPGELGIEPLCFEHAFYCRSCASMASRKTCPHDDGAHVTLSGTKVRSLLRAGELPPPEFSRPEVARVLIEGMRAAAG